MSVRLAKPRAGFEWSNITALFLMGTVADTLVSSSAVGTFDHRARLFLYLAAHSNVVFFWWAGLQLFKREFRWTLFKLLPLFFIICMVFLRAGANPIVYGHYDEIAYNLLVVLLMSHVILMAIHDLTKDQQKAEQRLKSGYAVAVGLVLLITALVTAYVEVVAGAGPLAPALYLLDASVSLTLCFTFAPFLFGWSPDLAVLRLAQPRIQSPEVTSATPMLMRLQEVMQGGAYKEEAINLAKLAKTAGVPEYRLRSLIVQTMGYANFNAFINEYRVTEAKTVLADPSQMNRQVALIALDLGFGSIATFNRVFKKLTGTTPTRYRKIALGDEP